MRRPTHLLDRGAAVSRRATLGLALGGTAMLGGSLSGCDIGDLDRDVSGTPTPTDSSPDVDLSARVLADVDAQLAAVVAARAAAPGLAELLRGLQEMHEAHRAVLDPAAAPTATPSTSATLRPARVLRRLRTAESAHQLALVEACVAARSGALARLLGSMSASVAQHLAVLPTDPASP